MVPPGQDIPEGSRSGDGSVTPGTDTGTAIRTIPYRNQRGRRRDPVLPGATPSEENVMRHIAVLSGLVLAGGLLGPSTALATEDDRHGDESTRWIAVEDAFTIVLPDGTTFTEEDAPPEEDFLPPVGSRLFVSEVLFTTHDGSTRGDEVGRTHIECTAQAVQTTFVCDGVLVFDTGSQLAASVALDFSAESEPASFDIAVTGGTGDYFGAIGALTLTDISSSEEETVSLYEADLVLPPR
jgi:hypothetical protein